MNQTELLLQEYEKHVSAPWATGLSGQEKVWFIVYPPAQERQVRFRVGDFEVATQRAHHAWRVVDLTRCFSRWMADHEYREAYFATPEDLASTLPEFTTSVANAIAAELREADESTVVALAGVGTLFGLTKFADVLKKVRGGIRGRLAVFFPGSYEGKYYRLLDARDGWDYLAIPITAFKGADRA